MINLRFKVDLESNAGFTLDTDELDGLVGLGFLQVPVTNEVRSVSWKRGRNSQLDGFSAGTCTVVFDNRNRQLDPSYPGSLFFDQLYPGRAITVTALQDYDDWPDPDFFATSVFSGYTESWSYDYTIDGDATATVVITDAFSRLSKIPIVSLSVPKETSGARVARILSFAKFPPALVVAQTGYSELAAETITDTDVLSYLQLVAQSEFGTMFIDGWGIFRFIQRNSTAGLASVFLSTDDDNRFIADINFDYSFDRVFNDVTLVADAYTVRGLDAPSVAKYGSLAKTYNTLIDSSFAAQSVANGVATLGVPAMLPKSVEINISDRIYSRQVERRAVELFAELDVGCDAWVEFDPDEVSIFGPSSFPGLMISAQSVSATPAGITFTVELEKQLGYLAFTLDTSFGVLDTNYLGV